MKRFKAEGKKSSEENVEEEPEETEWKRKLRDGRAEGQGTRGAKINKSIKKNQYIKKRVKHKSYNV